MCQLKQEFRIIINRIENFFQQIREAKYKHKIH
jgi:hypothetical protein